jgi:organic hydroperoxide reductase OsmC/OhrA
VGYDHYDRTHRASAPPAKPELALSSDQAFRGDPNQLNPESLLLLAASSCQLLSFLAVAARARIDVVAYDDDAEAVMPEGDLPMRVTEIIFRPRITVRGRATEDRIRHLVEVAHRECFIANSVTTTISIHPTITFEPGPDEAVSAD